MFFLGSSLLYAHVWSTYLESGMYCIMYNNSCLDLLGLYGDCGNRLFCININIRPRIQVYFSEFTLLWENKILFMLINFSTIHFPLSALPSAACVVWYWQSQQIIYSNFTPNLLEITHPAIKIRGWSGPKRRVIRKREKLSKTYLRKNYIWGFELYNNLILL